LGAWSGRRVLFVAAGILCLLQAVIAFSGVTLVFLIPALLFLRSAVSSAGGLPRPMRPARLLVIAALAGPVAVATILTAGIFGVLILTAIGGLGSALLNRSRPGPRFSAVDAIAGIGVIAFVIGAWFALLGTTEEVCWVAHASPTGAITYERIPRTSSISLGVGEVAGGCDGGTYTLPGIGVASILIVGALGLAAARANGASQEAFDD
jgi:hypothetical protein